MPEDVGDIIRAALRETAQHSRMSGEASMVLLREIYLRQSMLPKKAGGSEDDGKSGDERSCPEDPGG